MTRGSVIPLAFVIAGCGGFLSAFGEDPASDEPDRTDAAAEGATVEGGGGDSSASGDASKPDAGDGDGDGGPALRVFVTKGGFSGSALQTPDAKCQDAATNAQLGGLWRAWLSHPLRQAANVVLGDGPWRTLGGALVAADRAQLTSGTLAHPIDVDEQGGDAGAKFVWTGTSPQGDDLQNHCDHWNGTVGVQGSFGRSGDTDDRWTHFGEAICTNSFALYCFEQP